MAARPFEKVGSPPELAGRERELPRSRSASVRPVGHPVLRPLGHTENSATFASASLLVQGSGLRATDYQRRLQGASKAST